MLRRAPDVVDLFDGVRCFVGRMASPPPRSGDPEARIPRLALLPAGDADVASTRLRAFPLLGLLQEGSVRSARGTAWLLREAPDFAWIQKKLTPGRLRIAARLKEAGTVVVYDCDESGPDLDYWAEPRLAAEMLALADIVTTDTLERAALLREMAPSCRPHVLENPVDYANELSTTAAPADSNGGGDLRLLWFGHGSNLRSLAPYRDTLASIGGVRWVMCGPQRSQVRAVFGSLPVELHAWSRTGFVEVLRGCDVTLLSHFGSRHDQAKSAHKMVTSICHGVPALVSATPDYGRVAAFGGVTEEAVYSSPVELEGLLERMRSQEVRRAYLGRARPRLLERYGAGTIRSTVARLLGGGAG